MCVSIIPQALEKYRKNGGKLKCRQCVEKEEQEQRKAAAAKRAANESNSGETLQCKGCQKGLSESHFNKNQWSKGPGKARCRACVEKSLEEEKKARETSTAANLQAAKDKVAAAKASGNSMAILKAESELAALEAEKATGLKPQKMNRGGGGRGGGRGRAGRGRGRGRGGRR